MKNFDRRTFLKTNSIALAGLPLFSAFSFKSNNRTINSDSQKINFTRDGLDFNPDEYSELLTKLTNGQKGITDNYSRFGVVEELEKKFANSLGKESAVFMPTGTMANHIAVKILAGNKKRVLVQNVSHLYNDSGDCAQKLSGINLIPLGGDKTTFTLEQVKSAVKRSNQGRVKTGIGAILIESPVRRKDNEMFDFAEMQRISEFARDEGIKMHLDGARLFNAVAHSYHSVKDFTDLFDTVYVSLYKNFNAASGAILAGDKDQLKDLYHTRRMFGGGMPQVWPFAVVASHFAESFLSDYKKALGNFEIFKQELEKNSKLKIEKVKNGTNVFILSVLSGDALVLKKNLMNYNIILPEPISNTFKIKTNTSLLRSDPKQLAIKFINSLV
ncbi:MAG: DegT/DnrJ/EryC1/StrS family aminotransferase [Bacteroidales bacterium]|nr:DegT/DnrJ/EryC1/StrS family aminotransferase [Bacteroidales bacterium]